MGKPADLEELESQPTEGATVALYGAELGVGALVGAYVVMERRSRGGFATVYRARPQAGGPDVALKVLHRLLVTEPNMIQRFRREVEAVQRLDHPGIVRLLDVGELDDYRPYFVMEWLGGRTLEEELAARGAFSVAETAAVAGELCAALGAAHAAGIVHRDLKPANIILVDGRVKLVDFGIAKLVGDSAEGRRDLTSTGTRIGTPHYMSPEQIAGKDIDARSDIYSLGIVLYQLLSARLPFSAPSPIELEAHHLYTPPPHLRDAAPVPPAVDALVERCLAKSRDDRFRDVGELAAELSRLAEPRPAPGQIGVHVAARVDGDDDAAFDTLDRALAEARARCAAAGLAPSGEGGVSFLAVRPDDGLDTRARAIDLALALVAASPIGLAVTVHAGALDKLAEWVAPDLGVTATRRALAGVEERFALERPDGGATRVLGRRAAVN